MSTTVVPVPQTLVLYKRKKPGEPQAPPRPAKPKMGRPVSPGGAKTTVLLVRVSPAEKRAFETAAEREGKSVSAWVRWTLLTAAKESA